LNVSEKKNNNNNNNNLNLTTNLLQKFQKIRSLTEFIPINAVRRCF